MKQNRSTLKDYFKKGAIPTESNFSDLIDSMINQQDDNLSKVSNDPLKIISVGADESLLNFYRTEKSDEQPIWQVKQKPGGKSGLSINDAADSRLFIENGTGNIGIGTTAPSVKLDVYGRLSVREIPADDKTSALSVLSLITRAKGGTELSWTLMTAAVGGGWGVNPNAFEIWEYPATKSRLQILAGGNTILAPVDGNVGIGALTPIAKLDIATNPRSGTHPTAVKGLYITADINEQADGIEFRHSNASQGIGFGYNTIYATGTIANQDLGLKARGTGKVIVRGALSIQSAVTDGRLGKGSRIDFESAGLVANTNYGTVSIEENWGLHLYGASDRPVKIKGTRLEMEGNQKISFADSDTTNNLKLQLWTGYGLGINGATLFYAADGNHSWRDASGATERMLLTTKADGGLAVKGTGASSFAGSLGIGTSTLSGRLTVAGNMRFGAIPDGGTIPVWQLDTGSWQTANIMYEGGADVATNAATFGFHGGSQRKLNVRVDGNATIDGTLTVSGGTSSISGGYLYVSSETAGRLRVGAAWNMPGLYSGDDGAKDLILGAPSGRKVYFGESTNDAYVEAGTGNAYVKGNLNAGSVQSKPYVQSFKVAGDWDKFYPVVFVDQNWADGALELEINRPNVHTDSEWRGALISMITCHSTSWGHGADFCRAEIYSSKADFIAGYQNVPQQAKLVVWLRGGNTTYYWRANHLASVEDSAATAKAFGGGTFAIKTAIDPYVSKQVYFSAYVEANSRSGALNPLPMKVVSQNIGGGYDVSTSKFTAPVKGVYLFTMTAYKGEGSDALHWYLLLNNANANSGGTNSDEPSERTIMTMNSVGVTTSRTVIVAMNAGDYVTIQQTGAGRVDNFRSGLEGVLISPIYS